MPLPAHDRTYLILMRKKLRAEVSSYDQDHFPKLFQKCLDFDGKLNGQAIAGLLRKLSYTEKRAYAQGIRLVQEIYPKVDEAVSGLVTYRGFSARMQGVALLRRAREGMDQLKQLSKECVTYLQYVTPKTGTPKGGPAQSAKPTLVEFANKAFERWFDFMRRAVNLDAARAVMKKLADAVNSQPFEIVCEADPDNTQGAVCDLIGKPELGRAFGFVQKDENRYRFYACAGYFSSLASEIDMAPCSFVKAGPGDTYKAASEGVYSALNACTITCLHELTHITSIGDTEDFDNNYTEPYCKGLAIRRASDAVKNAENYSLFAKEVLMRMLFKTAHG